MCNYFGPCSGPGHINLKDQYDKHRDYYDALRDQMKDDLMSKSPVHHVVKTWSDLEKRANWLTQEEIDKMELPRPESRFRRILNWLNGEPGGAFTLFVLVMFCLGMWAAVALWRMR